MLTKIVTQNSIENSDDLHSSYKHIVGIWKVEWVIATNGGGKSDVAFIQR